ncbi:hypothetical protein APR04_000608 [Promicromonospora umidemergens]|uniref:Integral membrane protein n=1 Tax=Promicromonospora umidemergens TaxID=629679 RepID=A0ABP8XEE7_9MICO|nr:hypothetical protein [Promicromonospora umidemergens]MCP2281719.1 hypothetical protein [Promicromonospora umidemergens]
MNERTTGPGGLAGRGHLLRLGAPRDTAAVRHLVTFLVASVVTVLTTRAALAATGYPQLGGGGLHVAHVLWGGLLMALAIMLLLSYVGPAPRSLGAVLGGVGFGLFIDEVGKFVTSDNDYFYAPTAAIIYLVTVLLVLVIEGLHGRRAHHPAEYLAVAVDRLTAGLAGGLTPAARQEARTLAARGAGEPGADLVAELIDAVPDDDTDVPDPVRGGVHRVVRWLDALVDRAWAAWLVVGALLLVGAAQALVGVRVARGLVPGLPGWTGVAILVAVGASVTLLAVGVAVWRRDHLRGAVWVRRAVLISLLFTQLLVFRAVQWTAAFGLLLDVLAYMALEVALREERMVRARGDG